MTDSDPDVMYKYFKNTVIVISLLLNYCYVVFLYFGEGEKIFLNLKNLSPGLANLHIDVAQHTKIS